MEVPAGQVNFRGSLACSASKVLEPMLHPVQSVRQLPKRFSKLAGDMAKNQIII